MTNKIDWCSRLRDLASGKLTCEMSANEYSLAADEIERLRTLLTRYRNEIPLGHQPHMIAHQVDEVLGI